MARINRLERIGPFINNKFRNSLAYGTWAIENQQVVLFENAKLVPFEKLGIGDFLGKVKGQNLLFGYLSSIIFRKNRDEFLLLVDNACRATTNALFLKYGLPPF